MTVGVVGTDAETEGRGIVAVVAIDLVVVVVVLVGCSCPLECWRIVASAVVNRG